MEARNGVAGKNGIAGEPGHNCAGAIGAPPSSLANRYNEGKLRYDLVPVFALKEVTRVFTYGAIKYAPDNWRKGLPWTGCIASLERHLQAFKGGEDVDSESGLFHMAHLAVNALFLLEYYKTHPELDDRIKYEP